MHGASTQVSQNLLSLLTNYHTLLGYLFKETQIQENLLKDSKSNIYETNHGGYPFLAYDTFLIFSIINRRFQFLLGMICVKGFREFETLN